MPKYIYMFFKVFHCKRRKWCNTNSVVVWPSFSCGPLGKVNCSCLLVNSHSMVTGKVKLVTLMNVCHYASLLAGAWSHNCNFSCL